MKQDADTTPWHTRASCLTAHCSPPHWLVPLHLCQDLRGLVDFSLSVKRFNLLQNDGKKLVFWTLLMHMNIQVALEQHGFKQHGSTHRQIFSNKFKYCKYIFLIIFLITFFSSFQYFKNRVYI